MTELLRNHLLAALAMLGALVLTGCAEPGKVPEAGSGEAMEAAISESEAEGLGSAALLAFADRTMANLVDASPYLQLLEGRRIETLGDNSFAYVEAEAAKAAAALEELGAIDESQLDHDDRITYAILTSVLQPATEYPAHFWHKFNVTPYAAGTVFSSVLPSALATYSFATEADTAAYLRLLRDLARYVNDDLTRLKGQDERGILLPKSAIPGARKVFEALRTGIGGLAGVAPERLGGLTEEQQVALNAGIESVVAEQVLPAIDALLDYMGDDYVARAPEAVGLSQYPGGEAAYRFAIRQETTMDLDPADIHQRGLAYMADIQQQMQAIRVELGFEGTAEEFHEQMRQDPRFFAQTPDEVEKRYMAYIREVEPHIPDYFSVLPEAPYGVKRLDPAAEPGMTFGYYQPPSPASPRGNYRYNGSKLKSRPMVWTGPLIFHELVPGHHFHIALQRGERCEHGTAQALVAVLCRLYRGLGQLCREPRPGDGDSGRPIRALRLAALRCFRSQSTGGGYGHEPLRLAAGEGDGLHVGKHLFQRGGGRHGNPALLHRHAGPGAGLQARLGEDPRNPRRQEAKLGDVFDIRTFHAAVLGSGAMPLPVLEEHVDWYMRRH